MEIKYRIYGRVADLNLTVDFHNFYTLTLHNFHQNFYVCFSEQGSIQRKKKSPCFYSVLLCEAKNFISNAQRRANVILSCANRKQGVRVAM